MAFTRKQSKCLAMKLQVQPFVVVVGPAVTEDLHFYVTAEMFTATRAGQEAARNTSNKILSFGITRRVDKVSRRHERHNTLPTGIKTMTEISAFERKLKDCRE